MLNGQRIQKSEIRMIKYLNLQIDMGRAKSPLLKNQPLIIKINIIGFSLHHDKSYISQLKQILNISNWCALSHSSVR